MDQGQFNQKQTVIKSPNSLFDNKPKKSTFEPNDDFFSDFHQKNIFEDPFKTIENNNNIEDPFKTIEINNFEDPFKTIENNNIEDPFKKYILNNKNEDPFEMIQSSNLKDPFSSKPIDSQHIQNNYCQKSSEFLFEKEEEEEPDNLTNKMMFKLGVEKLNSK